MKVTFLVAPLVLSVGMYPFVWQNYLFTHTDSVQAKENGE